MLRLFRVFIPASVLALLFSELAIGVTCFVLATFLVLPVAPEVYLLRDWGLQSLLAVVFAIVLVLYYQDMYASFRVRSRFLLIQQFSLAIGMAFLVQTVQNYALPNTLLPRQVMLVGSVLFLGSGTIFRYLYGTLIFRALGAESILFVGSSPMVWELNRRFRERPEIGFRVAGYLGETGPEPAEPSAPRLGDIFELKSVVEQVKPDRIVVGMTERRGRLPVYELLDLRFQGIPIEEAASVYETAFGRISLNDLNPSQLIFSAEMGPDRTQVSIQSLYSWVLGLIGLVLTLPVMILVAIAVRLTSKGPALYSQTRTGLGGKPFKLYKFRSMRVDAEAKTGAVWATKDDPRITPIGKWLRKLRLDELPQFFNILKGEMSIVGPRPERPEFVRTLSEQIPFYQQRHCVKPGLTGWAQINYKYGDTIEDVKAKLEYDLYYIKHLNASLDFYIMFQTVKVMLLSRGAQ
ncbi:MAG: sugar transferase [Bryobacteraceae bacterium]|nr:sugar transferase [Bryobacteraceae bacterium]